jgi:hypothetical protein
VQLFVWKAEMDIFHKPIIDPLRVIVKEV